MRWVGEQRNRLATRFGPSRTAFAEGFGERRSWLWGAIGIGFAAFVAIGAGIGLAGYREAGHGSALDIVGLCWMVTAIGLLGLAVALYPLLAHTQRADSG